jgi:hypothetical protein
MGRGDRRVGVGAVSGEHQERSSGRSMGVQDRSGRWSIGAVLLGACAILAAGLTVGLLSPAQAQFWSPFGAPRRPPAPVQQAPQYYNQQPQQQYNPFGGFFGPQEVLRPKGRSC